MEENNILEGKDKIIVPNQNGENVEYDLIAYVPLESGNFVVYTNNNQTDDGYVELHVSSVLLEEEEITFGEVTDEELSEVINYIKEKVN